MRADSPTNSSRGTPSAADSLLPITCPLCGATGAPFFLQVNHRAYYRCSTCWLVFVSPESYLPPAAERAHYDLHENDPADERYREFLNRLCAPLLRRLSPHSQGLDFGCGPGPTLSVMLEEGGHQVALFDPFYADDPAAFEQQYDFITASEVVEHLHHPAAELERLWSCLKPGGVLGIMTKLVTNPTAFAAWHYIQDPTHVCFFSTETWHWLASHWEAAFEQIGADVALFVKPPDGNLVH